jgi:demethylmenaquinone methyltransferase/2-methoxy-6-polyprenyl-1,4-benzoquinol methylase
LTLIEIPIEFVGKARFVKAIFTDVEKEYDVLVHLMTLSLDWVWRRRMFARMVFSNRTRVLDLACGTGLVTFNLTNLNAADGYVVGLDLSASMLRIANQKKHAVKAGCDVDFVRAVGEFLPFRNGSFRYVTIGLALRNLGDTTAVFQESLRVLLEQGWFLSVDFVRPENILVWRVFRVHIFHVIPALGGLVSAHWKYTLLYLANSILKSTSAYSISEALSIIGFQRTFTEKITLGVVALVGGQKQSNYTEDPSAWISKSLRFTHEHHKSPVKSNSLYSGIKR